MSTTKKSTTASARTIKKYPNRRLYDTEISSYITLEDIRQLVLRGEPFQVVEKRSGKDITRTILLQVISEQEEGGNPIFSTKVLRSIIRFYGDSMQGAMSSYLELSLEFFNEQQNQFKDRLRRLLDVNNPLAALKELSQHQLPIWRTVRQEFLKNLPERGNSETSSKTAGESKAGKSDKK